MTDGLKHLKQRLSVSGILLTILFLVIYLSNLPLFKPVFAIVTTVVIGFAMYEYYRIAELKGFRPFIELGISTGSIYCLLFFLGTLYPSIMIFAPYALGFSLLLSFIYFFFRDFAPLLKLSLTFFGILYIAVPLSCILSITFFFSEGNIQDGRWWLTYALATTKATDSAAYFCGKLFGKRPLAAHISPQKTFEGALGGLFVATLVSMALPYIASFFSHKEVLQISFVESIWFGIAIGIVSQIGDLSESLLKRDAGVKDSNILPGLGGILDMIDSLIFTIPLVYLILYLKGVSQ